MVSCASSLALCAKRVESVFFFSEEIFGEIGSERDVIQKREEEEQDVLGGGGKKREKKERKK